MTSLLALVFILVFFFQAEDGIRDRNVTGVQTCALPISDRLKDVIKSGGEWISSIDMENAMVGHPKVNQAAVVGLEHPKWDERPFMLLVLHDGEEITTEEVHEHL